jgi:hypothetical protein
MSGSLLQTDDANIPVVCQHGLTQAANGRFNMRLILAALAMAFIAVSIAPASNAPRPDGFVLTENKETTKPKQYKNEVGQCLAECPSTCAGSPMHNCQKACECHCRAKTPKEAQRCPKLY